MRDRWPIFRQFQRTPVNGLRPLGALVCPSRPLAGVPMFSMRCSCSICLVNFSTAWVSWATVSTVSTPAPSLRSTAETDCGGRYDSISRVAVTASSSVAGCFWRTLKAICGCGSCVRYALIDRRSRASSPRSGYALSASDLNSSAKSAQPSPAFFLRVWTPLDIGFAVTLGRTAPSGRLSWPRT